MVSTRTKPEILEDLNEQLAEEKAGLKVAIQEHNAPVKASYESRIEALRLDIGRVDALPSYFVESVPEPAEAPEEPTQKTETVTNQDLTPEGGNDRGTEIPSGESGIVEEVSENGDDGDTQEEGDLTPEAGQEEGSNGDGDGQEEGDLAPEANSADGADEGGEGYRVGEDAGDGDGQEDGQLGDEE